MQVQAITHLLSELVFPLSFLADRGFIRGKLLQTTSTLRNAGETKIYQLSRGKDIGGRIRVSHHKCPLRIHVRSYTWSLFNPLCSLGVEVHARRDRIAERIRRTPPRRSLRIITWVRAMDCQTTSKIATSSVHGSKISYIDTNKAGYTAQDAPSTRLKITWDRRTYGPTDGHTLL